MTHEREPETERREKITTRSFRAMKESGQPISMVTAYDFPTAQVAERAGIDAILVGDSLAMVVLGHENTLAVTMDEMLHHARAVRRGATYPLLIGDMPFMSYQADVAEAVRNAGRFLKEAGMDAVKLEGGSRIAEQVRAISRADIPVMGHLGLTPQSVHALGGWKVQGRSPKAGRELLRDALVLQDAGCFAIVLESIPVRLAELVTLRLRIPTIGIGAGSGVDGQVLVMHDLLGLFDRFQPRFVKRYADLNSVSVEALRTYRREVQQRLFPGAEHSYTMSDEAFESLRSSLEEEPGEPPKRALRGLRRA